MQISLCRPLWAKPTTKATLGKAHHYNSRNQHYLFSFQTYKLLLFEKNLLLMEGNKILTLLTSENKNYQRY